MAPPRRLGLSGPLKLGQSTIFSALNSSLAVARPPPRLRGGPKLKRLAMLTQLGDDDSRWCQGETGCRALANA
jgi:hypothetical protein